MKFKGMDSDQEGFSLIEILIGLLLVGLILSTLNFGGSSGSRRSLDQFLKKIERGVRFSIDEAALRNSIVRLHFDLDKNPQSLVVEFGPNDNFILPIDIVTKKGGSLSEEKKRQDGLKKLNNQFSKVKEFQEKSFEVPPGVRIIGVGTSLTNQFQTEGHAAVYVYPTGEKDDAIIILGTDDEVAGLKIEAYNLDMERFYEEIEAQNVEEDIEAYETKAIGLFEEWLQK